MQRSALCRSRRELSNEYLLAKIGIDTAENEPLEVCGKIIQYYSFVSLVEPVFSQSPSLHEAGFLVVFLAKDYERLNCNRRRVRLEISQSSV